MQRLDVFKKKRKTITQNPLTNNRVQIEGMKFIIYEWSEVNQCWFSEIGSVEVNWEDRR